MKEAKITARKNKKTAYACEALSLFCRCVFLLFLVVPVKGYAENGDVKGGIGGRVAMKSAQAVWNISAAKISYDKQRNVYEAEGNVVISSEGRLIQADWAELDSEKKQAELRGNVYLQYDQDWIRGNYVFWNLDEETGWVDEGLAYFAMNRFYVQGEHIEKTGPNEYHLKKGMVTSCDPARPDWDIRYKEMKIDLDGIAWVKHTSLWVRDYLPVMYVPAAAMPINRGRQSGFLIPWAGSSSVNGLEAEVPFYWAMREDMDATFYGRYMIERGFMGGLEYRIDHNTWGKGTWLFNYLNDQADKDHLQKEGYPFETEDRYWLRARHLFKIPGQIRGFLDLDYASDRNLLKEFTGGSVSYGYSNRLFGSYMGRGILNDDTIPFRESSLYLERPGESSLVGLDMRYWEQLVSPLEDYTLQRLPELSFNVVPSWVDGMPLYYTLESSWVNYWREKENPEDAQENRNRGGSRLDLHPRIYYPFHWKTYLDAEVSAGLHTSSYWVDWQGASHDQWQSRLFSEASFAMSSRINRVYALKIGDIVAVEHAIRPEVVYEYFPEISQGTIPQFDGIDQDLARHDVRYGFTSFLTTKEVNKSLDGKVTTSYREIARLKLSQAYNIEPTQQLFFDSRFNTTTAEGFSDITARLDIMPKRYLTLTYDTDLSTDRVEATRQSVYLVLDSGRGQSFSLSYHFRENTDIDEIIAELKLKVLPSIYLSTYQDYALRLQELFSQGYGITYQHGCWGLTLAYERENEQDRVTASVNLMGLGTFGYKVGQLGTGPVLAGPSGKTLSTW